MFSFDFTFFLCNDVQITEIIKYLCDDIQKSGLLKSLPPEELKDLLFVYIINAQVEFDKRIVQQQGVHWIYL